MVRDTMVGAISAQTTLNEGLIVEMGEAGRRFKANEFDVPEVLLGARAMQAAIDVLKPLLAESKEQRNEST